MLDYVHISDTLLQLKDVLVDWRWHLETLSTIIPNDVKLNCMNVVLDGNMENTIIWVLGIL